MEHIFKLLPGEAFSDGSSLALGDLQYHVGCVAGLMQRGGRGPRHAKAGEPCEMRYWVILPTLKIGVVWKNEIGHRAGFVEKRGKADRERDFPHRASQRLFRWMIGQRIGGKKEEHINR